MSKYIRTKNAIYERLFKDKCLNKGTSIIVNGEIMPYKEDVIAQADTIEELCDGFVVDYGEGIKHFISNYEYLGNFAKYKNVYGGIWLNEWGLKYVAKLNDKGELELLWLM